MTTNNSHLLVVCLIPQYPLSPVKLRMALQYPLHLPKRVSLSHRLM
jgi:hypothetical protein